MNIDIDEHFDWVSKQNLKFQFEFVDCAPLRVAVAHMSTDDASRLKNFMLSDMSRPCLGLVSVMCRSCFCVAWVMSRGVTVMSRSCFS